MFIHLFYKKFPAYRGLFIILDCLCFLLMVAAWVLSSRVLKMLFSFWMPDFLATLFLWLTTFLGVAVICVCEKNLWKPMLGGKKP